MEFWRKGGQKFIGIGDRTAWFAGLCQKSSSLVRLPVFMILHDSWLMNKRKTDRRRCTKIETRLKFCATTIVVVATKSENEVVHPINHLVDDKHFRHIYKQQHKEWSRTHNIHNCQLEQYKYALKEVLIMRSPHGMTYLVLFWLRSLSLPKRS